MWENYEQQGAEHTVMGMARDSFALTASYLSAYSLCPGISLTYIAVSHTSIVQLKHTTLKNVELLKHF